MKSLERGNNPGIPSQENFVRQYIQKKEIPEAVRESRFYRNLVTTGVIFDPSIVEKNPPAIRPIPLFKLDPKVTEDLPEYASDYYGGTTKIYPKTALNFWRNRPKPLQDIYNIMLQLDKIINPLSSYTEHDFFSRRAVYYDGKYPILDNFPHVDNHYGNPNKSLTNLYGFNLAIGESSHTTEVFTGPGAVLDSDEAYTENGSIRFNPQDSSKSYNLEPGFAYLFPTECPHGAPSRVEGERVERYFTIFGSYIDKGVLEINPEGRILRLKQEYLGQIQQVLGQKTALS